MYLCDFTALLSIADTMEKQTLTMAWSSESSKEEKALVAYDEETGAYCVLKMSRQTSSKDVGVGIISSSTKKVKLKVNFKCAVAKNQAARDMCQELMDKAAGDLVGLLEKMTIFEAEGN